MAGVKLAEKPRLKNGLYEQIMHNPRMSKKTSKMKSPGKLGTWIRSSISNRHKVTWLRKIKMPAFIAKGRQ